MAAPAVWKVKTAKQLYPRICSLENLYSAAAKARKRKTRKQYVEDFALHRERFLAQLQDDLLSQRYCPRGYQHFYIHDPKKRLISAAPYRDRVVHHALCNVLEPIVQRRFVQDSYSCQKGKGTMAARERCRGYTNRFRYVLKCDVRKFFQSIDQKIMLEKLSRIIRCDRTVSLCSLILESYRDKEIPATIFTGDDLFSAAERKRGLPIGNLTSQLWANCYLDHMDHYIKEELRVPGYARYTDDWLIWSDDKGFLRFCEAAIMDLLQKERLAFNSRKTRIIKTKEGVPFLGFRFLPGKAPIVLGTTKRRFERRTRRQRMQVDKGEFSMEDMKRSVFGWVQFSRYGNVTGLLAAYGQRGFGLAGT